LHTLFRCFLHLPGCKDKQLFHSSKTFYQKSDNHKYDNPIIGGLTDPGNKLRNIAYGIVISPDTTLWPAVDSD
jgi:hypothetical protein